MIEPVFPWLLGFVGLGLGYLLFGDSLWLWATSIPPIVLGYWLIWPR